MSRYKIVVKRGDETFYCDCLTGQTLSQALIFAKAIPFGCHGGGCGMCRIKIIHGSFRVKRFRNCDTNPNYFSEEKLKQGIALACLTCPTSDMELEVLGKKGRPFKFADNRSPV